MPGATPALIDKAMFEAARERIERNKAYAWRRAKREYSLRGMVFCGVCGRRLIGVLSGGTRSYRYPGHRWESTPLCGQRVNANEIESGVWQEVKAILSNPDLIREQIERRIDNDTPAAEFEERLAKVESRLKALAQGEAAIARQLRQGLMSEAVATKELRQGQADRAAIERERETLLGQIEAVKRYDRLDIEGLCHLVADRLEAPTPAERRLAFEALGVKVTMAGHEAQVSLALPVEPPDEFDLHISRRGG